MIFNKKRVFLYSSILLLILVGIYYSVFVEGFGAVSRNSLHTLVNATRESNATQPGIGGPDWGDLVNWTRGGGTELYVFTINFSVSIHSWL